MKLIKVILIGIVFITLSCNNDVEKLPTEINGEYVGMFERNGTTANVKLTFNNGTYSGESDTARYPAICNGSYSISSNSINFQNKCIWTADFDWTLILSYEWNYNLKGNTLLLTNSNGDKYTLTKQ